MLYPPACGRSQFRRCFHIRENGPQGVHKGYSCITPLDAVGSVQRRRRWSGRCGMLIIARGTFRVRFGGSFGSPPGFHRRRKLSATFRRKIELFFAFLTAAGFFGSARLEDLAAARRRERPIFSRLSASLLFPPPVAFVLAWPASLDLLAGAFQFAGFFSSNSSSS